MGSVTITESEYVEDVNKTTSITFECFEDFLAYDEKTRNVVKGPLTKLEVLKEYRVIGNSNGHDFKVGDVVRITGGADGEDEYTAEYLDGSDFWYVVAKDLEEI